MTDETEMRRAGGRGRTGCDPVSGVGGAWTRWRELASVLLSRIFISSLSRRRSTDLCAPQDANILQEFETRVPHGYYSRMLQVLKLEQRLMGAPLLFGQPRGWIGKPATHEPDYPYALMFSIGVHGWR